MFPEGLGDVVMHTVCGLAGIQLRRRPRLRRAVRDRLDDRHGRFVDPDRGAARDFRPLADLGQSRSAGRGGARNYRDRNRDGGRDCLGLTPVAARAAV